MRLENAVEKGDPGPMNPASIERLAPALSLNGEIATPTAKAAPRGLGRGLVRDSILLACRRRQRALAACSATSSRVMCYPFTYRVLPRRHIAIVASRACGNRGHASNKLRGGRPFSPAAECGPYAERTNPAAAPIIRPRPADRAGGGLGESRRVSNGGTHADGKRGSPVTPT